MKATLTHLQPLINSLPTYDNNYHSFYNIIGVNNKENYNSNVLAYFFNPEGEHGLGTLWIDSLLECLEDKSATIPNDFELSDDIFIKREKVTSTRKRVDLVIRNETSAIIIENKIGDKNLRNDLDNYWNSIKVDYKVGVVLSVEEKQIPEAVKDKFTLVQHHQLIQKVQDNLFDNHLEGEEKIRQTAFLEDYFQHINKLYKIEEYQKAMKKEVSKFFEYKTEIEQVVKFQTDAKAALINTVDEVMNKFDFNNPKVHYYPKSKKIKNVRFYLNKDHLVEGKLSLVFELRNELARSGHGENICIKINKEWTQNEKFPLTNGHHSNSFYQLGTFWTFPFYPAPEGLGVLEYLADIIETAFFKIPEGQTTNFVDFCINELHRLQNKTEH